MGMSTYLKIQKCNSGQFRLIQIDSDYSTTLFILLIRDMLVECWNRQHHGQTIHPTEKFISMDLFQILCVVIWAQLFLTSMVVEAIRGRKHHIWARTLVLKLNILFIPQRQFCLPKIHQEMTLCYDSQPTFSLHILMIEPSPQDLISSNTYISWKSK